MDRVSAICKAQGFIVSEVFNFKVLWDATCPALAGLWASRHSGCGRLHCRCYSSNSLSFRVVRGLKVSTDQGLRI